MLFENPADCFVLRSAVSEDQRLHMLRWANDLLAKGALNPNSVGYHRQFCKVDDLDEVPEFYWTLRRHLAAELGVSEYDSDPNLGDLVTCNEAGAQIHRHRDPPDGRGRWHLRVNLYLQAAEEGGEPVLRDHQLDLSEGDAWAFIANATEHWNTPVGGTKPRLTFSFGMMFDQPDGMLAQFVLSQPRIKQIAAPKPFSMELS